MSSNLESFISEFYVQSPNDKSYLKDIYLLYKSWSNKPVTYLDSRQLSKALHQLNYVKSRDGSGSYIIGLIRKPDNTCMKQLVEMLEYQNEKLNRIVTQLENVKKLLSTSRPSLNMNLSDEAKAKLAEELNSIDSMPYFERFSRYGT